VITIDTSRAQPLLLLPAFINERGPFALVLDTGAGTTVITEELSSCIGLEATEVREAMGAAGRKIAVSLGTAERISIGDSSLENVQVGIVKDFPRCAGQGAIGYNFLREFILTIDYRGSTVQLASSTEKRVAEGGVRERVPLRIASPARPVLLVDVLINDRSSWRFFLDTGASQTVISPALAREIGIVTARAGAITGAGGEVQGSVGQVRSLSVGKARRDSLPVVVSDIFSHLSQALGVQVEGILGYDFLSNFKVEIDYHEETVSFER